jgi:DNA polymerase V
MNWGGVRKGAGRPTGQGKYGEKTKPVRIPENMIDNVLEYINAKGFELPLYSSNVSAGSPSPADEYIEGKLDLNTYLIKNPPATFLVRATGDSMIGAGIYSGDVMVVDRSIDPKDGKIVIAAIDGHLTVKRLSKKAGRVILKAENPKHQDIILEENSDLIIWGVVTSVLHKL